MANLKTVTPNRHTLLMNPGDRIRVRMLDAPAKGGGSAFKAVVTDVTTGRSGFMQASAANGFMNTDLTTCNGTPFNFQPEFSTAAPNNIAAWTALQVNISTQFEIGHFEPCTSVTDPSALPLGPDLTDTFWNRCHGPYESNTTDTESSGEVTDAPCYPAGDTHGVLNTAPNLVTGCTDFFTGGDLDFDGTSYWADWPTGSTPTATFPGSFVQQLPTSDGAQYPQFFLQTDTALSEATCTDSGTGCAIPAPIGPGNFYPYWTRVTGSSACTIEFGNVSSGAGVNNFGGDAQYGENKQPTLGYPEFEGPVMSNACSPASS
jgi:hypothetical protein